MSAVDRVALLTPANVRHRSGGTLFNRAVAAHAAALGHRVDVVPVRGLWPRPDRQAPGRVLAAAAGYRRVLVDGLIATRNPAALTALARRGVHTGLLVHLPERHGGTAQARALAAADVVVVTSAWTGRWLLAHAWPLTRRPAADLIARLVVARPGSAHPGAAARPATPPLAPSARAGSPRIACVAALTPNKNQLALVRALAETTDAAWSAEFIGSRTADPRHAARVRDAAAPLGDRVRLTGELDAGALDRRWPHIDLLVLPSTWESWGMVVTEALRHGVPALVGRGTGAAEALAGPRGSGAWRHAQRADRRVRADALPGAVVDPEADAIAAALRPWLTDPQLRTRWRDAATDTPLPGWDPATRAVLDAMRPASRTVPTRADDPFEG
ncbi:glycosyl transferase [Tersicoccus solisilvae]|uniref:Glycosyl transferase n=1 Tax=Tersicoccus solisilvae TaxID=1882339 RepID=A0ABQ1NNL2_9MICC|nr:glycosyltransferase family 4 protein [Tersicoccus solisilvae]GGC78747.1 glycosyl transferase [Tersicoccus solisilvae]